MQTTRNGRALPPRPALMVGDEEKCLIAWDKLKPRALDFLRNQQLTETGPGVVLKSSNPPQAVQDSSQLVWQLRALRESLISNGMLEQPASQPFAAEVYELSAEVCAAAGNHAELLKCLQVLVSELHPALAKRAAASVTSELSEQPRLASRHATAGWITRGQQGDALCTSPVGIRQPSASQAVRPCLARQLDRSTCLASLPALGHPPLVDADNSTAPSALHPVTPSGTSSTASSALRPVTSSGTSSTAPVVLHSDNPGRVGGSKSCNNVTEGRQAEFIAAQLLFFACVPSVPSRLDILSVLQGAAAGPCCPGGKAWLASSAHSGSPEPAQADSDLDPAALGSIIVECLSSGSGSGGAGGDNYSGRGGGLDGARGTVTPNQGHCWRHAHVRYAVSVMSALSTPDPAGVLVLAEQAPTALLRSLVGACVCRARLALLRVLASAYRSLPREVVEQMLGLKPCSTRHKVLHSFTDFSARGASEGAGEMCPTTAAAASAVSLGSGGLEGRVGESAELACGLVDLLKAAAGTGCRGAATALAVCVNSSWEGGGQEPEILVFKG